MLCSLPRLTIVASNRDRFDIDGPISKFWMESLEKQKCKNFCVLIADGGSKNYDEIKGHFEKRKNGIDFKIVRHDIGELFERARLNNVGIRNSCTEYVMTTDVDMWFHPLFVETLLSKADQNTFIESRTFYLKGEICKRMYNGEVDPYDNVEVIKIGRIKKRTTAGGCQCAHIDAWRKVRGFDENFIGWGSEDFDLYSRFVVHGYKIEWLGENDDVFVFHQDHLKPNIKIDLQCQERNKKILKEDLKRKVNVKGWGGIYEL